MGLRFVLSVLISIVTIVSSTAFSGEAKVGASIGVNSTSLDYEETLEIWRLNKRSFVNFSVEIELTLYRNLAIQTGIRYNKIGNDVDLDFSQIGIPQIDKNFKITQSYLAFPAQIKFSISNRPTFYIQSGLEIGYLLSASAILERMDNSKEKNDIKETLNKINLNALIGVGAEIDMSRLIVFVESHYAHGLTDIPKNDEWLFKWRLRELSFNLGFKIKLN